MIDKLQFKKSVYAPFRANGFTKKGDSWYLTSDEVVVVINFQKSSWAELYFINVGFGIRALGLPSYPLEHMCHICPRAGDLFPEYEERIFKGGALTEDSGYTPDNFVWLVQFVENELIPYCKRHLTVDSLKKFCQEPSVPVRKIALDWLSQK